MALSREEREQFLAEPHIGALSVVERPDRAPLTVPIWYQYEPGGDLWIATEPGARKMQAIRCYASQFDGATNAGEIFPTGQDLYSLIATQNAHYGSLIRTRYGEPFYTHETLVIDDVTRLGVQSM